MGKKLTTEQFIERARKIHGDKYDYSKVEYNGNHTKVCIICSLHGEFWQTPAIHLKGCECPKCIIEKNSFKQRYKDNIITNENKLLEEIKKYDI